LGTGAFKPGLTPRLVRVPLRLALEPHREKCRLLER